MDYRTWTIGAPGKVLPSSPLTSHKGLAYHQDILNKVKKKANITEELTNMQEIQRRLKHTWNSINNL